MIAFSLYFALFNKSRSLEAVRWWYNSSRSQLFFANREKLFKDYDSIMDILAKANAGEVGLCLGVDDWEYPFWVMAKQKGGNDAKMTFKHVGVNNVSRMIKKQVLPEYVIVTRPIETWKRALDYVWVYTSGSVSLYKKQENAK